jgi:hypothetical protein
MNTLNLKISIISVFCLVISTTFSFAQQGKVTINQDKKIVALLELKKEMNKNENDSERYKIQIYNGHRGGAYATQKEFDESYGDWHSIVNYEPPNFKTWVGNFRTRLEADRALVRIKIKFPSAFIFKPKK